MRTIGILLLALLWVPLMGHAEGSTITCQKSSCEEYKLLEQGTTHSLSAPTNEHLDVYRIQGTNRGKFSIDWLLPNQEYDREATYVYTVYAEKADGSFEFVHSGGYKAFYGQSLKESFSVQEPDYTGVYILTLSADRIDAPFSFHYTFAPLEVPDDGIRPQVYLERYSYYKDYNKLLIKPYVGGLPGIKTDNTLKVTTPSGETIVLERSGDFLMTEPGTYQVELTVDDRFGKVVKAKHAYTYAQFDLKDDPFTDMKGRLYNQPINKLYERKIINGYSDGTFRPNAPLTRLQAARMINRHIGWTHMDDAQVSFFKDVDSDSEDAPDVFKAMAYMDGRPDKTFAPYESITRAQLAKVLVKAYNLEPKTGQDFNDVPKDHWAHSYIQTLAAHGIITGYGDGTFRPNEKISREHYALLLYRTFDRLQPNYW